MNRSPHAQLHLVRDGEPVIRSVPARCSHCYEPLAVVARHPHDGSLLTAPGHRCARALDPRLVSISVACFAGAALLAFGAVAWRAFA